MKDPIKFRSEVVSSTRDENQLYHDDMFAEDVFITLPHKPQFIESYDYREFNGVPIKEVAEVLNRYHHLILKAEMEYYKWRRDRNKT